MSNKKYNILLRRSLRYALINTHICYKILKKLTKIIIFNIIDKNIHFKNDAQI